MPRLLHLADVHLGARHQDLGPAASGQRERQFEAFRRAIDLALEERVDVVLVAGDLFDSNQQPRRSVERAAAEFGRVAAAGGRVPVPFAVPPGAVCPAAQPAAASTTETPASAATAPRRMREMAARMT